MVATANVTAAAANGRLINKLVVLVCLSAVVVVVPLDVVKWAVKFRRVGLDDASAVALVTLAAAKWMAYSRLLVLEKASASAVIILAIAR
jgi:hypothetical protein